MSNLLVVDFDFFFPNPMQAGETGPHCLLYDWGHQESPLFLSNAIWNFRAAQFLTAGQPLPTVTPPTGGWPAFWSRFRFTDDAQMLYADSNSYAGRLTPNRGTAFDSVLLFDAHHDSGYRITNVHQWAEQGIYTCEDWMLVHQHRGCTDLTVRYPTWRRVFEPLPGGALTKQVIDDGQPVPVVFDTLFICRSGAWVPPWCDPQFQALVDACPLPGTQCDTLNLVRPFSIFAAQAEAAAIQQLRKQAKQHTR